LYGLSQGNSNKNGDAATNVVSNIVLKKETTGSAINLEIYPNPVIDVVHVAGLEGKHTITIMNALGQVVVSVKGTSTQQELDLSGKTTGIYLIRIELQEKTITRKLIKK
jgi:hypothetical protein